MAPQEPFTTDNELTDDDVGASSKAPAKYQLDALTFPVLELDSTTLSQPRHSTPPAALSSLGARMADHSSNVSVSSLDDAYDMVDDISDFSSDDHETVSLASTNNRGEEDAEQEHDTEDNMSDEEQTQLLEITAAEHQTVEVPALSQNQAFKVRLPFYNGLAASTDSEHMLDSVTDELETPIQSVITAKAVSPSESTIAENIEPSTLYTVSKESSKAVNDTDPKASTSTWKAKLFEARRSDAFKLLPGWIILLSQLMVWTWLFAIWLRFDPTINSVDSQRSYNGTQRSSELHTSLQHFTGGDGFFKQINYTHLLPEPVVVGTNFLGYPMYGTKDIRYQALAPNHLVVSLPQLPSSGYPTPVTFSVKRGLEAVDANRTQLIKGVHVITVDPNDAHGMLSVSMACTNPELAVSIAHDFGSRLLHLNTYEKACTDISKILAKDVALARHAAKAVSDNIQDDFESRMRLAHSKLQSKSRELTHLAEQASQSLRDAEKASMVLMGDLTKDIVAARKRFYDIYGEALGNFKSLVPTVDTIRRPILLARERSLTITQKIFEKHQAALQHRAITKAAAAHSKHVREPLQRSQESQGNERGGTRIDVPPRSQRKSRKSSGSDELLECGQPGSGPDCVHICF
ncbi:hypothetical protein AMS68_000064 [Peltaster fructicola]|uniref:Uncharacterized protein n=1 Tax=Peltaster fructicola TaxID=286661 RepID=A0A6H0XIJ9_9PEZI|nr:hypothetical protein AMS68_000064 [Peltaster fructicola]